MSAPPSAPISPDRTLRRMLGAFLVILAVFLGVVVIAVRNINRAELGADWVNHTHAVILEVDAVLVSVHAGDSALRASVMAGGDQTATREAFSEMAEHLEIAKALTRAEPAQHAQILQLETLARPRADLAPQVFAAWQRDHAEALRTLLAAEASLATLGEIRRVVEKLKTDEMALLAERDTASFLQAQATRWTVWTGVALDVILLGGVAWLMRDDILARRRAAAALEAANAQLEAKVRQRTAELSAANAGLAAENFERRWAQQAAEHQLHYHQIIFNSINDLVLVVTKVLNISRVNPAVVQLTGCETSALINRPLASILQLPDAPAGPGAPALERLALALRADRDLRDLPATVTDRHGGRIAVRLTLSPVRDGNKVVGGVILLALSPQPPAPPS